ncbi:MAG TPA: hypothetical protein PKN99_11305 [Cyclobacteriaceae bacterium]|nr:hypothetical protein [Cyclobacteriaceae bacterium]HNP08206.1 hypothetical protein [Cyclobacteriaceae bacterium]HRK55269.1 hypothetical protein [Cyclobacteriaceae bacterium]
MKYEWRKREKDIYLPKSKPEVVDIPSFQFLTISGEGNPNNAAWSYGLKWWSVNCHS